MRAMILAAGRGERMGALTAQTPKPLLRVNGQYLIEYSLRSLANIGIQDIVINVCYLKEQIKQVLGDGSRYGINIYYSEEDEALETGGGIYQALPLLGSEPFIVSSCDVISHFPLETLPQYPRGLAHLVLVDNPSYHPDGDFGLSVDNEVSLAQQNTLTFGNIAVYRPELFADCKPGKYGLGGLLKDAIQKSHVTGEHYQGVWFNVGSPVDLDIANAFLLGAQISDANSEKALR